MADTEGMRRILALSATILVALGAAGTSRRPRPAVPSPSSRRRAVRAGRPRRGPTPQIRVVTSAAILGTDPATFRPADPLTRGELAEALAAWGKRPTTPADPARLVTMRELDAQLVGALGLQPAAQRIRIAAPRCGARSRRRCSAPRPSRACSASGSTTRRAQDELELLPSSRRRGPRRPTRSLAR